MPTVHELIIYQITGAEILMWTVPACTRWPQLLMSFNDVNIIMMVDDHVFRHRIVKVLICDLSFRIGLKKIFSASGYVK